MNGGFSETRAFLDVLQKILSNVQPLFLYRFVIQYFATNQAAILP
jgi:hypothetical protein